MILKEILNLFLLLSFFILFHVNTESGSHNISPMHHVSAMDRISLILTKTMKPPIPSEVP